MNRWTGLFALVLSLPSLGCSKKSDVIVETSERAKKMGAADIDRDPIALLPPGALSVAHADARAFFASEFGQRLKTLAEARIPLPPSAGFDPQRDLSEIYVGVYSMQGVDTVVIAKGTFHPDKIEKAADGITNTPLGAPLVKTKYAKRTIYTSKNVGFVVLTEHTMVLGDETGIRRALDRLSEGRVEHDTPKWVDNVLATPKAAVAVAVNLVGQPPAEALAKQMPFLSKLQTGRIVGNFQPPGMNFAGTLTYPSEDDAKTAAGSIQQIHSMINSYSFFMSLAGIKNPLHRLEVVPSGADAQFVMVLEGRAVEWLLLQLADRMGVQAR